MRRSRGNRCPEPKDRPEQRGAHGQPQRDERERPEVSTAILIRGSWIPT